ncbi:MAG: LysR family transcriptional regulator [Magnetococcales bacterium]|nr:LysR family transcriptional regulator [Magnetococcales bacterium]
MKNNLQKVDLNLLVAFDVLMTERSVTQAGRVLGITQAAMSNTLKRLRQTFNDPLFIKLGHSMAPTALALKLSEPITKALDHAQSILKREHFDPGSANRLFRIAISECISAPLLPILLQTLRRVAPGVHLEILEPGGREQTRILDRGEADLLITWFQWVTAGKVHLHRLFDLDFVCIARPGNPHAPEHLSLDGFLAAEHVQYLPPDLTTTPVDEALKQLGHSRKIVCNLNSASILPHLIASTDFLSVLPDHHARFLASGMNLTVHPLPFKVMPLRIAMAWHSRTDESLPDRWMRQTIIDLFDSSQAGPG